MVLFGNGKNLKPDFITWVRTSLSAGKEISVVTDQIGNITLASNLAENIGVLIKKDESGLFSLSGTDLLSRYDIAVKTAKGYNLDASGIRPIKTADLKQAAPRPLHSGFLQTRARSIAGIKLLTFQEQMKAYEDEQKSADRHPHV
jgi:dTDP-4-dehydrorhamnose reductase